MFLLNFNKAIQTHSDFYPVSAEKCEDGRIKVTGKDGDIVYFEFTSHVKITKVNGETHCGEYQEVKGDSDLGLKWAQEKIDEINEITKTLESL